MPMTEKINAALKLSRQRPLSVCIVLHVCLCNCMDHVRPHGEENGKVTHLIMFSALVLAFVELYGECHSCWVGGLALCVCVFRVQMLDVMGVDLSLKAETRLTFSLAGRREGKG